MNSISIGAEMWWLDRGYVYHVRVASNFSDFYDIERLGDVSPSLVKGIASKYSLFLTEDQAIDAGITQAQEQLDYLNCKKALRARLTLSPKDA